MLVIVGLLIVYGFVFFYLGVMVVISIYGVNMGKVFLYVLIILILVVVIVGLVFVKWVYK